MDIAPTVKRRDSMMVESNIRQMGRLELLYTCLANLVREIARDGQTDDYCLLQRAVDEQTKKDNKGSRVLKNKEDGMTSDILQNPSDPDAIYRSKAGRSHKGYCANLIEAVDEKGSIIIDYQYDVNTRSDASFIKEYLENAEVLNPYKTIIRAPVMAFYLKTKFYSVVKEQK